MGKKIQYSDVNRVVHFSDFNTQAVKQLIADGDEPTFARLFHHYYSLLHPFVSRFTQSETDTEEILQETFMRVWLSRDKFPEIQNLHSWIFTIASRLCLTLMRNRLISREKLAVLEREESARAIETPVDSTQLAELSRVIAGIIAGMPPQRQLIYRMSREKCLKPAAIAEQLSLSVYTIKNVLVIALKEIRDKLAEAGHLISLFFLLYYFS